MIKKLGSSIVDSLIEAGRIDAENRSIYEYGFELIFMNTLNFITAIVIGISMNMLLECIIFQAVFIPLRSYSGGYHAEGVFKCYILSALVVFLALWALRYAPNWMDDYNGLFLLFISSCIIVYLAPIGNPNKPLDDVEKSVYGRRARIILACEFVLWLICYIISWSIGAHIVVISSIIVSISLLIGLLANEKLIV